jgi:hypothetical protein
MAMMTWVECSDASSFRQACSKTRAKAQLGYDAQRWHDGDPSPVRTYFGFAEHDFNASTKIQPSAIHEPKAAL